jgi:hypothetical protein
MKKCKLTIGKKPSWSFGLIFSLIRMMNLLARNGLPRIQKREIG